MGLVDWSGHTALVTGASRRVGRSIATALAEAGSNIIVHYNRSEAAAAAAVDRLQNSGVQAASVQGALDDPVQLERMWRRSLELAPEGRISLLVNNASIFPSDTVATLTPEHLEQSLSVNAVAPLRLIRLFAAQRHLEREHAGCVVNLLDSRMGGYMRKHVSYVLSKRALFSLTRMLALELAPRIRVNAVAPGMILPPDSGSPEELERLAARAPLGRWGEPEDVANAVVFLARNDYLTGQVLYVDGGAFIKEDLYG